MVSEHLERDEPRDTIRGMTGIQTHLRNTFLAGIFAATPIAITIFIIWTIESKTRGIVNELTGVNIPFIGVVVAVALIYALGVIVSSIIGRFFLGLIDKILLRVPVLKELYRAWKHVSLTPGGKEGIFAKVVLIPDELGGHYTMGFTSGEGLETDPDSACVFVPASPNPTNGKLYFVRRDRIKQLSISAEEAFKAILSGGNYVPPEVGGALRTTST